MNQQSIGSLFKRGLCDASYVGYTHQNLFQRVSEHQSSAEIGNHIKKDHNAGVNVIAWYMKCFISEILRRYSILDQSL